MVGVSGISKPVNDKHNNPKQQMPQNAIPIKYRKAVNYHVINNFSKLMSSLVNKQIVAMNTIYKMMYDGFNTSFPIYRYLF